MKSINFKILISLLLFCIILLAVSFRQNTAISNFPTTETALWQSAEYAIPATQTQSVAQTAQAWTPTATLVALITPTVTQTPVPVSPVPTATLPYVTPATPGPLEGVQLSGKIPYDGRGEPGLIELGDYHFDQPLDVDVIDYWLTGWSNDEKQLARGGGLYPIKFTNSVNYFDLGICISSLDQGNRYLYEYLEESLPCSRLYTNIYEELGPIRFHIPPKIRNISWSPDNNYLLATVKGDYDAEIYPCLVEVSTSSVDCRWTNVLESSDAYELVVGAYAIAWSPQDDKLAIPLKRNWLPINAGIWQGSDLSYSEIWDTKDWKQGLYLVDLTEITSKPIVGRGTPKIHVFTLLWEAPEGTTINHEQLPIWTSDGQKIAFVYVDPWIDIASVSSDEMPVANYVVALIDENSDNFIKLFDSKGLYLSGVLPAASSLPAIKIYRWIHQDRFLLFTVTIQGDATSEHEQSLFIYDTETEDFFQVTSWNVVD